MRYLPVILVLLSVNAIAEPNELFFANDANGEVVLTLQPCSNAEVGKTYPFRAYATEENGPLHEGCWVIPSIKDAPKGDHIKIIQLVNMYWDSGEMITYRADLFESRPATTEPTL